MMNNPLVLQQAELWAKNLLAGKQATTEERIIRMYRAALAAYADADANWRMSPRSSESKAG